MDGLTSLETMFALESDEGLKTKMCMNHLVDLGRKIGGDFNLNGELEGGQYLNVSVKMTKEKLIHDEMTE